MKKIVFLFAPVLFFTACSQEITIDLPEVEQKIVVDGGIVSGDYAVVTLTWSAGYFEPADSTTLSQSIIQNALVVMSDGALHDTLQPAIDFNYVIPYVYKGTSIRGLPGHTYTLSVTTTNNKTVTSTTTIPMPIPLDSVWFKLDNGQDSLGFVWAHLTDPAAQGDGYRWYTKRINEDPIFLAPFGSTFDDKFINNTSFDFAYNRPARQGSTAPDDNGPERGYFKIGDQVVVRFCVIGQREVNFFRTYETEVSNNGNPFASPGVVQSNVDGGLGIWCGYSASYDTLLCQ